MKRFVLVLGLLIGTACAYGEVCPLNPEQAQSGGWKVPPTINPPVGDHYQFEGASIITLGAAGFFITCHVVGTDSQKSLLMKNAKKITPLGDNWHPSSSAKLCQSASVLDCPFSLYLARS